jgi:RNA polymerase sigma-70 factor (ECF subfamily)
VTGSPRSSQAEASVSRTAALAACTSPPLPAALDRAFEEVFRSELSYVCRTLRRFGVDEADLEDVAQAVFVAVHHRFADRDPSRPLRPWLVAFAYRFASNHRRLARHRVTLDDELDPTASVHSPEECASDRERQALVLAALQGVKLERRPVLTMHDIDGFTPSEIAEALEIPVNTVYSRLRLARQDFRLAVAEIERSRVARNEKGSAR